MNKYIVTIPRGVLCFENGKQVEANKIIPFNIKDDEKKSKIDRGLIALFDPEKAAIASAVQVEKNTDIEKAFSDLTAKLEKLTKDIQAVREENAELKELCQTLQEENAELRKQLENLKKGGKK